MGIEQDAAEWVADRLASGSISVNTSKAYMQHFRSLAATTGPTNLAELDVTHLRRWMRDMSAAGMSPATKAARLAAVSSWLDYCVREGLIVANPADRVERPKQEKRKPRPASVADIRTVLARSPRRTRLMVLLEAEMGLRRAETAALTVEDILWADGLILVKGKGRKERHIPLTAGVTGELQIYLRQLDLTTGPLFRNTKTGEALKPATIGYVISRANRRLGLKVTAHNYRHRAGTDVARSHGIHVAQHFLGHASIATTEGYAQHNLDQVRAALADRNFS